MKPCWIWVTIKTSGERELKNLSVFETIRVGADGATEVWKDGRCAKVRETPAQLYAMIREAQNDNH